MIILIKERILKITWHVFRVKGPMRINPGTGVQYFYTLKERYFNLIQIRDRVVVKTCYNCFPTC